MNKNEKIKALKESIARIEKAINQLSYIKFDIVDLANDEFMDIITYKNKAMKDLLIAKSKLEKNLEILQETNENIRAN